jgi:tetratricopeptide (TPR) repeat protein
MAAIARRPLLHAASVAATLALVLSASAALFEARDAQGAPAAVSQVADDRLVVPTPDLRMIFTGSIEGHLEACGCTIGRYGGLDRITTQLTQLGAGGERAVFVDCGDFFLRDPEFAPELALQMPLKADTMLAILAAAGCDAVALGDGDLALGPKALLELSERHGVPFLCANLVDASNEPVFKRVHIVERAGLRIALFSLIAQNLVHPELGDDSTIKVGELAERQGLRIVPWRKAATDLMAALEGRVDVVVCASHLGHEYNRELAELCPRIDVICGPHWKGIEAPYSVVGESIVTFVHRKGANVTLVDRWWGGQPPVGDQRPPLGSDESVRVDGLGQRSVAIQGSRNLIERQSVLGVQEFEMRRLTFESRIRAVDEYLAKAGPFPTGPAHSVTSPIVHRNLERNEAVLVEFEQYHARLGAFWTSRAAQPKSPDSPFVDPARCAECHPEQYEFWKTTSHARAYSTLAITSQQYDAECFACHTVGFDEPGGFDHPGEVAGFENVQCAACHGPGARHLEGGASYLGGHGLAKVGSTCTQCHDASHDPDFHGLVKQLPETANQVQAKLEKVACPKMPPPGAGTPAFHAALAEAGDALRAQTDIPWSEVVRVYHRAGELESALAAAERYVDSARNDAIALRTHGLLLVEAGRFAEARERLERARPGLPPDGEVELALAESWLVDDPAKALFHAREAHSLLPSVPLAAASVARALAATSDRAGAVAFLERHLERVPEHATVLAGLLAELRGE